MGASTWSSSACVNDRCTGLEPWARAADANSATRDIQNIRASFCMATSPLPISVPGLTREGRRGRTVFTRGYNSDAAQAVGVPGPPGKHPFSLAFVASRPAPGGGALGEEAAAQLGGRIALAQALEHLALARQRFGVRHRGRGL